MKKMLVILSVFALGVVSYANTPVQACANNKVEAPKQCAEKKQAPKECKKCEKPAKACEKPAEKAKKPEPKE